MGTSEQHPRATDGTTKRRRKGKRRRTACARQVGAKVPGLKCHERSSGRARQGSVLARGLPSFVERDELPSVSGQRRKGANESSSSSSSSRRGKIQQQQSQGTIKYEG